LKKNQRIIGKIFEIILQFN